MLYLDSNSNYHIIKSCAIANLSDLQLCFEKLASTTNPQSKASLLGLIAKLSGVSFELLANDIEGVLGAIAQVNFEVLKDTPSDIKSQKSEVRSEIESEPSEPITLEDYHYQLVTSLVNAELAVDLESALKIASDTPYKDVEGYLKARVNFLNKDQIDNEKAGKELMNELADGSFFGSTKNGHDGFQKGVMAAMGIKQPALPANNSNDDEMPDSVKKAMGLD